VSVSPEKVLAGQAVYTRFALLGYDFGVLGLSSRAAWNCPSGRILEHYNSHITANHLDVGVGTGYFVDHCRFPSQGPRIALMDLNQNSLDFSSRRIARYNPEIYRRNILEPIVFDAETFDSVGVNYLLHCLPGSFETKAVVFDHLKALMKPDGVLFGATILSQGVSPGWLARRLMDAYNKNGIFSNQEDSLDGLKQALDQRFQDVSIEVVGCAALFSGRAGATL
jgi:SAM-dependent methyltransferase